MFTGELLSGVDETVATPPGDTGGVCCIASWTCAREPVRCLGKAGLSNAAEGRQVIPCHAHPSAPQLGVFCTWTNTEALEVTGTVVKLLQSTYVWEFFILL